MNKDFLIELAKSSLNLPPLTAGGRFPPSPYYSFFRALAATKIGLNTISVVLGVCGGGCCYHFAKGNRKGQVIGIDISDDYPDNMKFIKKECSNFQFVRGDSLSPKTLDVFKKHTEEMGQGVIDFLFLDTIHTYDRTLEEFKAYEPFLEKDAIVCLDDLFRPRMEDAFNELSKKYDSFRFDKLHPGYKIDDQRGDGGFGVIIIGE